MPSTEKKRWMTRREKNVRWQNWNSIWTSMCQLWSTTPRHGRNHFELGERPKVSGFVNWGVKLSGSVVEGPNVIKLRSWGARNGLSLTTKVPFQKYMKENINATNIWSQNYTIQKNIYNCTRIQQHTGTDHSTYPICECESKRSKPGQNLISTTKEGHCSRQSPIYLLMSQFLQWNQLHGLLGKIWNLSEDQSEIKKQDVSVRCYCCSANRTIETINKYISRK